MFWRGDLNSPADFCLFTLIVEGPSPLCDANYLNDKLGPAQKPLHSFMGQMHRTGGETPAKFWFWMGGITLKRPQR